LPAANLKFSGPARCFDGRGVFRAVAGRKYRSDILVIRYEAAWRRRHARNAVDHRALYSPGHHRRVASRRALFGALGFCIDHRPGGGVGRADRAAARRNIIEIDAEKGTLMTPHKAGTPAALKRGAEFASGYLWKYARQVGPALNGAVTRAGLPKACYADV
jgi:dihydroxy-acid dehydratase